MTLQTLPGDLELQQTLPHNASTVTKPSAVATVFALPELLEQILLHVGAARASVLLEPRYNADLFILRRVSRTFHAAITESPPLKQQMSLDFLVAQSLDHAWPLSTESIEPIVDIYLDSNIIGISYLDSVKEACVYRHIHKENECTCRALSLCPPSIETVILVVAVYGPLCKLFGRPTRALYYKEEHELEKALDPKLSDVVNILESLRNRSRLRNCALSLKFAYTDLSAREKRNLILKMILPIIFVLLVSAFGVFLKARHGLKH